MTAEHDFKNFPELTNNQMNEFYFDSPHKQITEDFVAKVVNVHDGDTIRVEWTERDFDFPIRLSNINSPELDEEGGEQSRSWLENILLNQEVEILIDIDNRVEKWGRLLGEILFQGMNINELSMIENQSKPFEDGEFENFKKIEQR